MGDAVNATDVQQAAPNKPPMERPPNMRETFSILETGEVVAIGIARTGKGSSAQLDAWVWVDQGKRWALAEQEYGSEISQQLTQGMERYEQVLRKDPRRAAMLRQRSDNTVDGKPNKDPDTEGMAQAQVAATEDGEQPSIDEGSNEPNLLQPKVAS